MTADVARMVYGPGVRREARRARLHLHLQGKSGERFLSEMEFVRRRLRGGGHHPRTIPRSLVDITGSVGGISRIAPPAPRFLMPYPEPHLAGLFGDPELAGFFSKLRKGVGRVLTSKPVKYAAIAAATYYGGGMLASKFSGSTGKAGGGWASLFGTAKSILGAKAAPPLPGSVRSPYQGGFDPFGGSPYGGGGGGGYSGGGGGGGFPGFPGGGSALEDEGYDGSYGPPPSELRRRHPSALSEAGMFGGVSLPMMAGVGLAAFALVKMTGQRRRSRRR